MTSLRGVDRQVTQRRTTAVKKTRLAQKQADLPKEQAYVDHAYQTYLKALDATAAMRSAPSPTNADHRAKRNTLPGEAPLGDKDPVAIGWAEDAQGRRFYVGKASVLDEQKNALVVNWKSKLGDRFMGAMSGDSKDLTQKRTFATRDRRITGYSDTVFVARTPTPADLQSAKADGNDVVSSVDPGDTNSSSFVLDDSVLTAMEAHRDSSMHDIVATIQADQYRVLTHDPADLLLIQGGPGTGKTAVALHRLSWLLYNQRDTLSPDEVLVVTPNPTLAHYIRDVLPALGDDDIRQLAIEDLTRELSPARVQELRTVSWLKSDARFCPVIRRGLRDRINLAGDRIVIRKRASRETVHLDRATVEKAYESFAQMPYLIGRTAFIAQLQNELVTRYPLPRRSTFEDTFDMQSLTAQADRVWPTLTPHRFLHDLLTSRRRLTRAASPIFTEDEIEQLVRLTAQSVSDEKWTAADTFLLHEVQAQMDPTSLQRFGHIVVDEAQDLTGMQLQALKRRSRSGAMTLAGDVAQSTGSTRRDSWKSLMAILTETEPGQSWRIDRVTRKTLKYVYRVPREAQVLANALQPEVAPDLDVPESLRESGYTPRVIQAGAGALSAAAKSAIEDHVRDGLMVGVIAPPQIHAAVAHGMNEAGIPFVFARNGSLSDSVTIVSPDGAKGLEFDAVVVVDPQRIYNDEAGPRLLYIALTRTTSRLDLVLVGDAVPDLLRPHLDMPDPPALERQEGSPAADVSVDPELAAEESVGSHSGPTSSEETATPPQAEGASSPAEAAEQRRGPSPIHTQTTRSTSQGAPPRPQAGSMEERFVRMNADLYLDEIRSQVRPELVTRIVEEMLAVLSQANEPPEISH